MDVGFVLVHDAIMFGAERPRSPRALVPLHWIFGTSFVLSSCASKPSAEAPAPKEKRAFDSSPALPRCGLDEAFEHRCGLIEEGKPCGDFQPEGPARCKMELLGDLSGCRFREMVGQVIVNDNVALSDPRQFAFDRKLTVKYRAWIDDNEQSGLSCCYSKCTSLLSQSSATKLGLNGSMMTTLCTPAPEGGT